ncbi:MAG: MFS transporter [Desulfobacterales bacterium]|nr:MAG: MFS transporter [Desulfobacterales bacterium]
MRAKYFYGYNIVGAGFVIQAVSIGAMFTYGVFFKELQADFGWSRATIAGASSLAFLIMGAVGVLAGLLNDRIGPKVLIVVSGISLGLGFLLMSRLQAQWQLYLLYGVLVGIGLSTHDVITLSTVARWFVKRRGMMSGIVKVGTGTGQLLVPLFVAAIIAVFGWRNAFLIIGALALVILVAVAQVLRRDPKSIGLLPDGSSDEPGGAGSGSAERGMLLRAAARTRQFWIICVAEFAIFFCLLTILVHIVPHASDLGLSPATAAGVLSTIGGVSMLGRIVMGAANDRIGGKRSLITCFSVLLCGLIWLQMAREAWMLFLFAVIYGFAHGGFFTVMSPTVAELFGTGSHGLLFGIVLFSGAIGGAVGPLLAGRTFDLTGSYQMFFLVLSGLAGIGFVLITLLRPLEDTGSQGRVLKSSD